MSQDECLEILRKCVEKSPIPGIQKSTLQNITKVESRILTFDLGTTRKEGEKDDECL